MRTRATIRHGHPTKDKTQTYSPCHPSKQTNNNENDFGSTGTRIAPSQPNQIPVTGLAYDNKKNNYCDDKPLPGKSSLERRGRRRRR